MASLPGNLDPHMIEKTLVRMFSPEWLRDTAKRVKYVQRQRKVDPFMCATKRRRAITIAQSPA